MKINQSIQIGRKMMASILAFLMVLNLIPVSTAKIKAATTEYSDAVTIFVVDEKGNPLEGVCVEYVIATAIDATATDTDAIATNTDATDTNADASTIKQKQSTNENGVIEIMKSSDFKSGMKISATISKDNYRTDSKQIENYTIKNENENIEVKLYPIITAMPLDAAYTGDVQDLVTELDCIEGDQVLYRESEDEQWTPVIPKQKDAGSYPVYVKVQREDCTDYETGKLEAKINKINLQNIEVEEYKGNYDTNEYDIVKIKGLEDGDKVTVTYNEKEYTYIYGTDEENIPTIKNVGKYKYSVKVHRNDNYNDFELEGTSEILAIPIEGLSASLKTDLEYTGSPQSLVKEIIGTEDGDKIEYKLEYKFGEDSEESSDEEDWIEITDIAEITGTDAGKYIVQIRVKRENYKTTYIDLNPAETTIQQAKQEISFLSDDLKEKDSVEYDESNNTINFAATSETAGESRVITYGVENAAQNDLTQIADIAEIDTNGLLTIKKGGYLIKVTAKIEGDKNYKPASCEFILAVVNKEDDLLTFANSNLDCVLRKDLSVGQEAKKTYDDDNGKITYKAILSNNKQLSDIGLEIDKTNRTIKVEDKGINKLSSALNSEEYTNGVEIKVTAHKEEGKKQLLSESSEETVEKTVYGLADSSYTIIIKNQETPKNPIILQNPEGEILKCPNGNNGYYNTEVTVIPAKGYTISKTPDGEFKDKVVFGNPNDDKDIQGEASRIVYLKNEETGGITAKIATGIEKLDSIEPDANRMTIDYPEILPPLKDNIKYYGSDIEVTFTAYDDTSGIDHFEWEYNRAERASIKNLENDKGIVEAKPDVHDSTKYTATIILPRERAEELRQLKGTLKVVAVDKANNRSEEKDDKDNIFVIDTISPKAQVTYQLNDGVKTQEVDNIQYFSDSVECTVDIEEYNFFGDDVKIYIQKDNEEKKEQSPETWSQPFTGNPDKYRAEISLFDEGMYTISIEYKDRSGNEMTDLEDQILHYEKKIVIDKTAPTIDFSYRDYSVKEKPQTATVIITEENFRKSYIQVDTKATNFKEPEISVDLQSYLRTCEWTEGQDENGKKTYTAEITSEQLVEDAIYNGIINYTDLALNSAQECTSNFTVDRKVPYTKSDTVSIKYSDESLIGTLKDTILSTITLGFYKPEVTMTFTAYDDTSGIDYFTWRYERQKEASTSNINKYDPDELENLKEVPATQDTEDLSKFTATVKLRQDEAHQLRGNISFRATDNCNNTSEEFTDKKNVVVVDTIKPKLEEVIISKCNNEDEHKKYYKAGNDIKVDFAIREINFFEEDVFVEVSKDGVSERVTPTWEPQTDEDILQDIHKGTYTIKALSDHSADGDYVITVQCEDKNENKMTPYKSDVLVIDTKEPEIDFSYRDYSVKEKPQTATMTIKEHNFDPSRIEVVKSGNGKNIAEDIKGTEISVDLQNYLRTCEWKTDKNDKDIYIAEIPSEQLVDAIYNMTITCTDLALNSAECERSFVVDRKAPYTKSDTVSIKYSDKSLIGTLKDTILSTITLGFYKPEITMTFTAYDDTSGIDYFTWRYNRQDGASTFNIEQYDARRVTIPTVKQDTEDPSKFTATVKLRQDEADQLRGHISFTATDNCNNTSEEFTDKNNVVVVDTIPPELINRDSVIVSTPNNTDKNKKYYKAGNDIKAEFIIKEANFFEEDVFVEVSKNGKSERVTPTWEAQTNEDILNDIHKGTYTIKALSDPDHSTDGDYIITINYTDRNKNKMTSYTSDILAIDTTSPEMTVSYTKANTEAGKKMYYNQDVIVTFTVNEKNFYSKGVDVEISKNGGIAQKITPTWEAQTDEDILNDIHKGTYTIKALSDHSADGDYVITVQCEDKNKNKMTPSPYTSDILVIDTKEPEIYVDYQNVNCINTLEDNDGKMRSYYDSTQTAKIKVIEHNFNPNEVNFTIFARDVAGNYFNADAFNSKSSWTDNPNNKDEHIMTIIYAGDANYTFDITCKDLATNEAKDYSEDYFTVDTSKPTNLEVSYSTSLLDTILSNISFGFYNAKATVTIRAVDNIASIHNFEYSYVNAAGVSGVNAELINQSIDEAGITYSNGDGRAMATTTFEIPREILTDLSQFNGTINFNATDRSGNKSDYLEDTKRIVVDNITPTSMVEYNAPVQTLGTIAYYDGNITSTVTIQEANFYSEDVEISVTKDGAAYPVNPTWSDNNTDVHIGTFTLTEDGDYFVTINYRDKSNNQMQEYTSNQMTIDTNIQEATITINDADANGKAFKGEIKLGISFNDKNYDSYEITLTRTNYAKKEDVTKKFINQDILVNETGGSALFQTFEEDKEENHDGIYTIKVSLRDKAGHVIDKEETFTVNRHGSVYQYSEDLKDLIKKSYVQEVSKDLDLVITEYNADRLVNSSIQLTKGTTPVKANYDVTPEISNQTEIGDSGWYQYQYTIAQDNFSTDGVYKLTISSEDATGNNNASYRSSTDKNYKEDENEIVFTVDSTAPEINSITGLEENIINATQVDVGYEVFDAKGLKSVIVEVDDEKISDITGTDFTENKKIANDVNRYEGKFTLKEKSNVQKVRLVVTDLAENRTDKLLSVTVSTNFFVRWYANKVLFWGSIAGFVAIVTVGTIGILFIRRKKTNNKNE